VAHLGIVQDATRSGWAVPARRRESHSRHPLEWPERVRGDGSSDATQAVTDGQALVREVHHHLSIVHDGGRRRQAASVRCARILVHGDSVVVPRVIIE